MLYDESLFVGQTRKRALAAFPGKIIKVETKASGNAVVTLLRQKEDREVKRDVIFRKIEMERYNLGAVLVEGSSIAAFGILTKKRAIFPVCFVKVKQDIIEIKENYPQYETVLETKESQQRNLDAF